MKKTYWWRVAISFLSATLAVVGWITFYPYKYALCDYAENGCIFWSFKKSISEPLFIFFLAFFATSLFLFFVSNNVFKKWIKFTIGWMMLSAITIFITPISVGGYVNIVPDRELVSIWMSALFLIISLVLIIFWTIKEKRNN